MVARVHTVAFSGIEVLDVQVQVSLTGGLPAFTIVGLPDKAVAESRERVKSLPVGTAVTVGKPAPCVKDVVLEVLAESLNQALDITARVYKGYDDDAAPKRLIQNEMLVSANH